MKKLFIIFIFALNLNGAEKLNGISGHLGGLFLPGPFFSFEGGAAYERILSERLALSINGSYNSLIVPLGFGEVDAFGVDAFLDVMAIKFNPDKFSHGLIFSIGTGLHMTSVHLSGYLPGKFEEVESGKYLTIPISAGIFYLKKFSNDLYFKVGIKSPLIGKNLPILKSHDIDEGLLAPKFSLSIGYRFL